MLCNNFRLYSANFLNILFFCNISLRLPINRFTVSQAVKNDSYTAVSRDSYTVSRDSYTVSRDSYTVCRDSYTARKDSYTVSRDSYAVSWDI